MIRRRFLRPLLTVLEDRLTPATLVWTDAGGDGLWTNAQNWFNTTTQAAALPTGLDDVVFDTGVAGVPGGGSNAAATLPGGSGTIQIQSLTINLGYAPSSPATGHVFLQNDNFIGGDVTLSGSGALTLSPGLTGVNGNWSRSPGFTFDPGGGTVSFGLPLTPPFSLTIDSGGSGGDFSNVSIFHATLMNHPLSVHGILTVVGLDTVGQAVTVGSLVLQGSLGGGPGIAFRIDSPRPAGSAFLNVAGAVDLTGADFEPSLAYTPTVGDSITLLHAAGGVTGQLMKLSGFSVLGQTVRQGTFVTIVGQRFRLDYGPTDVTLTAVRPAAPLFAVGAGAGGGPHVKVYNVDGSLRFSFFAYDPSFTGGVRVATADITGDGVDDIITGAGPGGGPHVKVFDGVTGQQVMSFYAYDPGFTGGVFVAAGEFTGDGAADIVTGAGAGGGPHVKVFDGKTGAVLRSFFAYDPEFTGGVSVAAASINGDNVADVITGAGPGGGPHVKVFDGATGAVLNQFFAYAPGFTGGVWVAAAHIAGEEVGEDIITGAGPGDGPLLAYFDGATGSKISGDFAFEPGFAGGVRVGGLSPSQGDYYPGSVLLGAGAGGGPRVRLLKGGTTPLLDFFAFDPAFTGGVFVG